MDGIENQWPLIKRIVFATVKGNPGLLHGVSIDIEMVAPAQQNRHVPIGHTVIGVQFLHTGGDSRCFASLIDITIIAHTIGGNVIRIMAGRGEGFGAVKFGRSSELIAVEPNIGEVEDGFE